MRFACRLLVVALLALPLAVPATATAAAASDVKASAAKKKTRAQKLRVCKKQARKKSGEARARALASCRAKYGKKKPADDGGTGGETGTTGTDTGGGGGTGVVGGDTGTGGGTAGGGGGAVVEPPPIIDPVRNDAGFQAALVGKQIFRQYAVPKPNHGIGYNYHDEGYQFCSTFAVHSYEGISYIYKSAGPWSVVEGYINGDGTKGYGKITYTQQQANFAEEVGKTLTIELRWEGTKVQITHPEIGINEFDSQPAVTPCP